MFNVLMVRASRRAGPPARIPGFELGNGRVSKGGLFDNKSVYSDLKMQRGGRGGDGAEGCCFYARRVQTFVWVILRDFLGQCSRVARLARDEMQ